MISIKKDTVEVTIVNNKPVIDKLSIDRKKKHKPYEIKVPSEKQRWVKPLDNFIRLVPINSIIIAKASSK